MNTDWRGFYDAPLWLIGDYLAVLEGERLVPWPNRDVISDAPPGFEMETVTEVLEIQGSTG